MVLDWERNRTVQGGGGVWFQPIGFRWAHNLAPYKAEEPQRMVRYYEAAAQRSAMILAKAVATR